MVQEENGEDKKVGESNEQVLERIVEKRSLLNSILCRKANCIRRYLRRNYLLHDVIEGLMMEVKEIGIRRRAQILYDLRIRRKSWELKVEAENRRSWKRQ